jgi:hypothetical protein
LSNSQLTGSISSMIGKLTALTILYVVVLTSQCQSCSRVCAQDSFRQQPDRQIPSTIGQLTALGYLYVDVWCESRYRRAHLRRARRALSNNKLTESIPETIGQLTSLTQLYVILIIHYQITRLISQHQISSHQPIHWPDSIDDCAIDETRAIVRCLVSLLSELTSLAGVFTATS